MDPSTVPTFPSVIAARPRSVRSIPTWPIVPEHAWAPAIVECDWTSTRDGELACRHSECDLHTTTNKMDAGNPSATTPEGYLGGTPGWRIDVYTGHAHVLSFKESIALNKQLGLKHRPELKGAEHQDRVDRDPAHPTPVVP
jgi:hypothetical protein